MREIRAQWILVALSFAGQGVLSAPAFAGPAPRGHDANKEDSNKERKRTDENRGLDERGKESPEGVSINRGAFDGIAHGAAPSESATEGKSRTSTKPIAERRSGASQVRSGTVAAARKSGTIDWNSRTSAKVVSERRFETLKAKNGLHVVGVTGFSGQWSEAKLSSDPHLAALSEKGKSALRDQLIGLRDGYGDSLVISSGATMEGVPKIVYDLGRELGIKTMGVTSEKAADFPLEKKMEFLIPHGKDWGDESPTFLRTSDEFIVLGGGGQAGREAKSAAESGKPVTVHRGFGGASDELTPADLPKAVFVEH